MAEAGTIKPFGALARLRVLALACIAMLVACGWAYLALTLTGMDGASFLQVLCQPAFGSSSFGAAQALLLFAMWGAMALAMMLPTSIPMILTYSELAETAAAKGEPAASPLILAGGYIAVWLGAALIFAGFQLALARLALLDPAMRSASPLFSRAMF